MSTSIFLYHYFTKKLPAGAYRRFDIAEFFEALLLIPGALGLLKVYQHRLQYGFLAEANSEEAIRNENIALLEEEEALLAMDADTPPRAYLESEEQIMEGVSVFTC